MLRRAESSSPRNITALLYRNLVMHHHLLCVLCRSSHAASETNANLVPYCSGTMLLLDDLPVVNPCLSLLRLPVSMFTRATGCVEGAPPGLSMLASSVAFE